MTSPTSVMSISMKNNTRKKMRNSLNQKLRPISN